MTSNNKIKSDQSLAWKIIKFLRKTLSEKDHHLASNDSIY